ncbi:hypothetical protein ACFQJ7_09560 [Halovenus rubra]|uniref:Uncharacterized protein n=2 Tax=Halovenus rubra TaxID=869890 RepID=A0ACC7DWH7_9EURY|nr:hypothetical protein [Halovenus rubra]
MAGFSISLSLPVALLLAATGSVLIYRDATERSMQTADMWAVGFFVAFFVLPIIGGVIVLLYYLQKRDPNYPQPEAVPST